MPDMRNLDSGARDAQDQSELDQEALRVREPAPIHHSGVRHQPDWPFLYTWRDGAFYLNRAPRKRRDLKQYGDAPW